MKWLLLAFGLYLDLIPVLAICQWTDRSRNPPSPVPVLSWVMYLLFALLLVVAWWVKIAVFLLLFFGPVLYRNPVIEARRRWLVRNGK